LNFTKKKTRTSRTGLDRARPILTRRGPALGANSGSGWIFSNLTHLDPSRMDRDGPWTVSTRGPARFSPDRTGLDRFHNTNTHYLRQYYLGLGVLTDRIISDFIRDSIRKIIKIIRSVSRDIGIQNSFTDADADTVRPLPIRIRPFSYYSSIYDIIRRYPIRYYPILSEYVSEIFLLYIF
jgi:hypothetical protein